MNEKKKWYDKMFFYKLILMNEQTIYWWSELSLSEIKESIEKQGFVFVSSGRKEYYKEEDINTKVIRSVKDITREERKSFKERDEDLVKRLRLIKNIRRSEQPPKIQRLIKKIEKNYQMKKEKDQWDWHERSSGMHLDVLMTYNEDYLKEILEKCKKIDLVS